MVNLNKDVFALHLVSDVDKKAEYSSDRRAQSAEIGPAVAGL